MVNDLVVDHDRRWKFVDDTSVSEVINKNEMGKMQCRVNDINTCCIKNEMKLNQTKCKGMIISFAIGTSKIGSNIFRGARTRSSIFGQNPAWHVHL